MLTNSKTRDNLISKLFRFLISVWRNRVNLVACFFSEYERLMRVIAVRRLTGCQRIALNGTFSGSPDKITIGSGSAIRDYFMIRFKYGSVSIGDNVLIANGVTILAGSHNYEQAGSTIISQGNNYEKILIGDDVWIGANATIMNNVKIGKGAVVAAMSLVNKDIPSYEVWGGVPAKFIKKRNG